MSWFPILNDFLNFRQQLKSHEDSFWLGTGYCRESKRSRLNPFHWILGERKLKAMDPSKVVIDSDGKGVTLKK
jgi:hypothetical protein